MCVRHLESWTPADAAAASTDSRCSPFGLGLNQQRGGGEFVYPHGFIEVVESLTVIWCNAEERCQTLSTEEDAQCLYTPSHSLRLTLPLPLNACADMPDTLAGGGCRCVVGLQGGLHEESYERARQA